MFENYVPSICMLFRNLLVIILALNKVVYISIGMSQKNVQLFLQKEKKIKTLNNVVLKQIDDTKT